MKYAITTPLQKIQELFFWSLEFAWKSKSKGRTLEAVHGRFLQ